MNMKLENSTTASASRRAVMAGGAGRAVALVTAAVVAAQDGQPQADFLFVQTAEAMAFDADKNRLTLRGVSPVTLFFSDNQSGSRAT